MMASIKAHLNELRLLSNDPIDAPLPSVPREMLVITEPDLHRVVAFSLDSSIQDLSAAAVSANSTSVDVPVMYSIGSFGHNPSQFATLAGKVPMARGTLLIGDAGNNNIQEFNLLTGKYIRTVFGPGQGQANSMDPVVWLKRRTAAFTLAISTIIGSRCLIKIFTFSLCLERLGVAADSFSDHCRSRSIQNTRGCM